MVRLFLLNEIKKSNICYNGEFGACRDNGLAVIQTKSQRIAEHTAKTFFIKFSFKITIDAGLIQTDI